MRFMQRSQSKSITDEIGVLYEQVTGVRCRSYPSLCFLLLLYLTVLSRVYKLDANSLRDL